MKRRIRTVSIVPHLLLAMMQADPDRCWQNVSGVPHDATLFQAAYDSRDQVFRLYIEHPSFDEVEEGYICPDQEVRFETVSLLGASPKWKFREFL
jgi:hypothetical protein